MYKIGIQTPHYAPNYGAQLQAFALGAAIKQMGYQIEYINRRPDFEKKENFLAKFLFYLEKKTKLKGFGEFEKKYLQPQTFPFYSNDDYSKIDVNSYYAFVVGSDQIWRDDYFHSSFEYAPYLYYVPKAGARKIAYAASFGKENCIHPLERNEKIRNLMSDFKAISVREKSGVDILKDSFGINDGTWVADPTLLHEGNFYVTTFQLTEKPSSVLVTYILGRDINKMNKVKQIADNLNIKVSNIYQLDSFAFLGQRLSGILNRLIKVPSVTKWLESILNAKYVITDSFHGMVFSILFHKQFVVLNNTKGGTERYTSLLGKLGIIDRLLNWNVGEQEIQKKLLEPINYSIVDRKIKDFREFSRLFLKEALD